MKIKPVMRFLLLYLFFTVPLHALDEGVENLRQTGKAFASVARKLSPSVVFVQVEGKDSGSATTHFFSPFGDE